MPSIRTCSHRPRWRGAILAVAVALSTVALPSVAQGHVNRTVGPYTILVVLVEEPLFQDNHAGFEFWVRKDGSPVDGLDQTLRAEAVGHGTLLNLAISPRDATGFYLVDRTTGGEPFDPHGGGAWRLRLTGTIRGSTIDEWFAIVFPAYPRVAATTARSGPATIGQQAEATAPPVWLIAAGTAGAVLGGLALLALARRRRIGGQLPS